MYSNQLAHNYLLNASSKDSAVHLFKIACQVAKSGHSVFYVCANPLEKLPFDGSDPSVSRLLDRTILSNIIFKYFDDPTAVVKGLMEIQISKMKPRLIILDFLHTFFQDDSPSANVKNDFYAEFARKHMLIIATVQNSIDTLTKCLDSDCYSIVCVDSSTNRKYDEIGQTIVDTYFYEKDVIFHSHQELFKLFETIKMK